MVFYWAFWKKVCLLLIPSLHKSVLKILLLLDVNCLDYGYKVLQSQAKCGLTLYHGFVVTCIIYGNCVSSYFVVTIMLFKFIIHRIPQNLCCLYHSARVYMDRYYRKNWAMF